MKLYEAIAALPPEKVVAVGSKSAYVFIGEAGLFLELCDRLSEMGHDRQVAYLESLEKRIQSKLSNGIPPYSPQFHYVRIKSEKKRKKVLKISPEQYAENAIVAMRELQRYLKYKRCVEERLRAWTPFRERDVKHQETLPISGNLQILFDGQEIGDFWDKEEFDAWLHGNMPQPSEPEEPEDDEPEYDDEFEDSEKED